MKCRYKKVVTWEKKKPEIALRWLSFFILMAFGLQTFYFILKLEEYAHYFNLEAIIISYCLGCLMFGITLHCFIDSFGEGKKEEYVKVEKGKCLKN